MLQAAHRLRVKGLSFHLKIIGDGPERLALEAQARALNLDDCVTFMGYLSQPALERTLANTLAVIMPSLAGEVFGLVALERMMEGRVVIISAIGALDEVVGDVGLKFPPGDTEGLAKCMAEVIANPSLVREVGQRARERAKQFFGLERMIGEHLQAYEELLKP